MEKLPSAAPIIANWTFKRQPNAGASKTMHGEDIRECLVQIHDACLEQILDTKAAVVRRSRSILAGGECNATLPVSGRPALVAPESAPLSRAALLAQPSGRPVSSRRVSRCRARHLDRSRRRMAWRLRSRSAPPRSGGGWLLLGKMTGGPFLAVIGWGSSRNLREACQRDSGRNQKDRLRGSL
jgi:hypothetical protein